LYANTTRAFMLLDQDPNREAEKVWNQVRRAHTTHGLNTVQALHVARHVWNQAYTASHVVRGAARVGITVDEKLDRLQVMVARADELFKSGGSLQVHYDERASETILRSPTTYTRAAAPTKCTSCHARITVAFLFCHRCGARNPDYDEASAVVQGHVRGKRQRCEVETPELLQQITSDFTPEKQNSLKKWMGDLVKHMKSMETVALEAGEAADVNRDPVAAITTNASTSTSTPAALVDVDENKGTAATPLAKPPAATPPESITAPPPPLPPPATPPATLPPGPAADALPSAALVAVAPEPPPPPPAPAKPAQRQWSKAELGQGSAMPNSKSLLQTRKRFLTCLRAHAVAVGQDDAFADDDEAHDFAELWATQTGLKRKAGVGAMVINDANTLLNKLKDAHCPKTRFARWVHGWRKSMPEPDLKF
jgi:hypothetical protein